MLKQFIWYRNLKSWVKAGLFQLKERKTTVDLFENSLAKSSRTVFFAKGYFESQACMKKLG